MKPIDVAATLHNRGAKDKGLHEWTSFFVPIDLCGVVR